MVNFFIKYKILLAILVIYSCDNSVEPLDTDTGIYSVYGAMDLNKDVNYIRIRDLNAPFTAEATETIDATVFFENLETGMIETLEGIQQEYEGIYQYNFVLDQPLQPDTDYRLVVERSDGAAVQIPITTPTKPTPQVSPLNQNCFIPIDFELEPVKGSTIALRVGFPREDYDDSVTWEDYEWRWSSTHVLEPENDSSSQKITFTFIPHEQVNDAFIANNPTRYCWDYLFKGAIYISYEHYSPGFYEQTLVDSFDIFGSTQRLGALYSDTVAIPVDTSEVCTPDCF